MYSTQQPIDPKLNGEWSASEMVQEAPHSQVIIPQQERHHNGRFWTIEEHRQFLHGLRWYGLGNWKNISRDFITIKTPVQVSSHAQKYFCRLERTSSSYGSNSQIQGNLVG
ncbi:hypothetical protein SETIT_3G058200v2 [Setaria italica]|uniref:Uncharacterized protein n=1 Tax=Setaria italica TaxID=4555 RepID=K3ZAY9_SETIT|nr:hypothetical protein SETIT_3G058200v2 [Setaria italica]